MNMQTEFSQKDLLSSGFTNSSWRGHSHQKI